MKQLFVICSLFFAIHLFGQNNAPKGTAFNNDIEYFTSLNKNIQNGKIRIRMQDFSKKNASTQEYEILFCKIGINAYHETEFQYNILSLRDSVQYVYNHQTWYVINHKKQTYEVETDSSWCKTSCRFPYLWPSILLNKISTYYLHQHNILFKDSEILSTQKENAMFCLKTRTCYPLKDKVSVCLQTYTWNTETLLLSKCNQQIVEVGKNGKEKRISEYETELLNASLNKDNYSDFRLYNGENYVKTNYKRIVTK